MNHKHVIQIGEQPYSLDFNDDDHLLFVCMGSTLTAIQCFESDLCYIISSIMKNKKHTESLEKAIQENSNKTLGQLANICKSYFNDIELSEELKKVINNRNYFIHGFLKHYEWPMSGYTKLAKNKNYNQAVEEMDVLQKDLKDVLKRITNHVAKMNLTKIAHVIMNADGNIEVIANNHNQFYKIKDLWLRLLQK